MRQRFPSLPALFSLPVILGIACCAATAKPPKPEKLPELIVTQPRRVIEHVLHAQAATISEALLRFSADGRRLIVAPYKTSPETALGIAEFDLATGKYLREAAELDNYSNVSKCAVSADFRVMARPIDGVGGFANSLGSAHACQW